MDKKMALMTNFIFVLTDILEGSLMDMEREFAKKGSAIRFDVKRNYNKAIYAIRCLKRELMGCGEKEQTDFGHDADTMNAFLLTLIDRVGDDDMMLFRIYEYIKSMPSKMNMDLDDLDDAFSYLFEKN